MQLGVRTHFVQEEPQGLRCLTIVLATCVVERRIHKSGPSDFGIFSNFGASFIFLECKLIRRRLLVLHILVVLQ